MGGRLNTSRSLRRHWQGLNDPALRDLANNVNEINRMLGSIEIVNGTAYRTTNGGLRITCAAGGNVPPPPSWPTIVDGYKVSFEGFALNSVVPKIGSDYITDLIEIDGVDVRPRLQLSVGQGIVYAECDVSSAQITSAQLKQTTSGLPADNLGDTGNGKVYILTHAFFVETVDGEKVCRIIEPMFFSSYTVYFKYDQWIDRYQAVVY